MSRDQVRLGSGETGGSGVRGSGETGGQVRLGVRCPRGQVSGGQMCQGSRVNILQGVKCPGSNVWGSGVWGSNEIQPSFEHVLEVTISSIKSTGCLY